MNKPIYVLSRIKSPTSDIVVFWTGELEKAWSESPDDAVVFRSKTAAENVARSKRWAVRQPGEWNENPLAVEATLVELKLSNFDFDFELG